MIPKGTAWQHLRSMCFDSIPVGTMVHYSHALSLHEWRQHGSFQVASCTKKSVSIESAGVEFGSALLTDAEHLLDHAAEHRATLRGFIAPTGWHSPAWAIVTAYYWAFFCIIATTRLAGNSIWFLDRSALADLRKLAGGLSQPGAGALNVVVGPYVSAINREVTLYPTRSQLHDAVWSNFHALVGQLLAQADQTANSLEYRMLWCLNEARARLGADWPSKLRNLVNYGPGRGYREVTQRVEIDMAPYIRKRTPFDSEKLVANLEDEVIKIKAGAQLAGIVPLLCRILSLLSIIVAEIATEAHLEVLDRRPADTRWFEMRRRFLLRNCAGAKEGTVWPVAEP